MMSLCLACSSSLVPKAQSSALFSTACCARPICENCLARNPRLRGYNPCLACLRGVAVVSSSRAVGGNLNVRVTNSGPSGQSWNQEEMIFVLGDSDEDETEMKTGQNTEDAPPPYSGDSELSRSSAIADGQGGGEVTHDVKKTTSRYYIQPRDTLRGIALKYDLDGRKICELNSLPFTTLSTTPHLLHTRSSVILPSTNRPFPLPPDPKVLEARNRERAEKRFQFVTKEVDWRVAKAYVALAEDDDDSAKSKEEDDAARKQASGKRVLEARAVDRYLDDEEWESGQSERQIQGFPPFSRRGP